MIINIVLNLKRSCLTSLTAGEGLSVQPLPTAAPPAVIYRSLFAIVTNLKTTDASRPRFGLMAASPASTGYSYTYFSFLVPDFQLPPMSPDSLQAVARVLRYGRINKVVSVS